MLRHTERLDSLYMKVVKIVSLKQRPPLHSRIYSWYLFLLEAQLTPLQ